MNQTPLLSSSQRTLQNQGYSYSSDTVDRLRQELKENLYPQPIDLRFEPDSLFTLSDGITYIVSSKQGGVYTVRDSNIRELDLRLEESAKLVGMLGDNECILLTNTHALRRVNIADNRVTFEEPDVGGARRIISGTDKYYVLVPGCLKSRSVNSNTGTDYKLRSAFGSAISHVFDMDVREEWPDIIAAFASTRPAVYVCSLRERQLLKITNTDEQAQSLKLTSLYLCCAHADYFNVYSRSTWDLVCTLKTRTREIASIACNHTESALVTGGTDGIIEVWSLEQLTLRPQRFVGCNRKISKVIFSQDNRLCFMCGDLPQLRLIPLNQNIAEYSVTLRGVVKQILVVPGENLICNVDKEGLFLLNRQTLEVKLVWQNPKSCSVSVKERGWTVLVITANEEDGTVRFNTLSSIDFSEPYEGFNIPIRRVRCVFELIANLDEVPSQMEITNLISDHEVLWQAHNYEVTVMKFYSSRQRSVSGDKQGNILLYDMGQRKILHRFKNHSTPITALTFSTQEQFLLSGCAAGDLRLFDCNTLKCIWKPQPLGSTIRTLWIEDDQYFMVSTEDEVFSIWSFRTKTQFLAIQGYTTFCLFNASQQVCLAGNGKILSIPNPLFVQHLTAFGPQGERCDFFNYVHEVLERQTLSPYQAEFNNWLILPHKLNLAHLYTYTTSTQKLQRAFSDGILLVEDQSKDSPLSLSVKMKSPLLFDIIAYLIFHLRTNRDIGLLFEGLLAQINRLAPANLSSLYEALLLPSRVKGLPRFSDSSMSFPVFTYLADLHTVKAEAFFKDQGSIDQAITFKEFIVPMNFSLGSRESLEFLDSLSNCTDELVFRTEFIGLLLDDRWSKLRYFMILHACFYFLYLLSLILYIAYKFDAFIIVLLGFTGVFSLYELLQLVAMRCSYFSSILNIMDMLRNALCVGYAIVVWTFPYHQLEHITLLSLTILSLFRGIMFFNAFQPTRTLSSLIKEVFTDTVSFMVVLVYSIIAVSTVFRCLDELGERGGMYFYIIATYKLGLGDFSFEQMSEEETAVFVAVTLIITVILMNLLISIIGDTFDRVQQNLTQTDRKSICDMLLEVENLVALSRPEARSTYFVVCNQVELPSDAAPWEGKLRLLSSSIAEVREELASDIKKTSEELRKDINGLKLILEQVQNSLVGLKEDKVTLGP